MSHVIRQQKQEAEFDNHLLYTWYCNSEPMLDNAQFHITHFLFCRHEFVYIFDKSNISLIYYNYYKKVFNQTQIILASAYPRFLYLLSFLQQHVETDDIRYSLETSQ